MIGSARKNFDQPTDSHHDLQSVFGDQLDFVIRLPNAEREFN